MIDYIYLGSSPAFEPCVQTTDPDYHVKAHAECERYKRLLEHTYAEAHGNRACPARLVIKAEPHDFGSYYEVVAKYDTTDEAASLAAYWLDENAPTHWPEQNLCQSCDDSCIGPGPMVERC